MGIKLSWFVVTATCKDTGSGFNGQNTSDFEVRTTRTTPATGKSQSAVWSHFYEQSSHV
jgi:hypothetical protein